MPEVTPHALWSVLRPLLADLDATRMQLTPGRVGEGDRNLRRLNYFQSESSALSSFSLEHLGTFAPHLRQPKPLQDREEPPPSIGSIRRGLVAGW